MRWRGLGRLGRLRHNRRRSRRRLCCRRRAAFGACAVSPDGAIAAALAFAIAPSALSPPLKDTISLTSSPRVSCTSGRSRETLGASLGGAVASAADGAISFVCPSASMPGSTTGCGALRGQFRTTIAGMATLAASATASAPLRFGTGRFALTAAATAAPSPSRSLSTIGRSSSATAGFAGSLSGPCGASAALAASSFRSPSPPPSPSSAQSTGADALGFDGQTNAISFATTFFDPRLALSAPPARSSGSATRGGGPSPRMSFRFEPAFLRKPDRGLVAAFGVLMSVMIVGVFSHSLGRDQTDMRVHRASLPSEIMSPEGGGARREDRTEKGGPTTGPPIATSVW